MEQQQQQKPPRTSRRLHELFLERFKGKIACVDKSGHIGVVLGTTRPVEKVARKYSQQPPEPSQTMLSSEATEGDVSTSGKELGKKIRAIHHYANSQISTPSGGSLTPVIRQHPTVDSRRFMASKFSGLASVNHRGSSEIESFPKIRDFDSAKLYQSCDSGHNSKGSKIPRRKSLPRSCRARKSAEAGTGSGSSLRKRRGEMEQVARTNFQKIAYFTLESPELYRSPVRRWKEGLVREPQCGAADERQQQVQQILNEGGKRRCKSKLAPEYK